MVHVIEGEYGVVAFIVPSPQRLCI